MDLLVIGHGPFGVHGAQFGNHRSNGYSRNRMESKDRFCLKIGIRGGL